MDFEAFNPRNINSVECKPPLPAVPQMICDEKKGKSGVIIKVRKRLNSYIYIYDDGRSREWIAASCIVYICELHSLLRDIYPTTTTTLNYLHQPNTIIIMNVVTMCKQQSTFLSVDMGQVRTMNLSRHQGIISSFFLIHQQ